MKLVTFQSLEALEFLNKYGYLETDEKYIEKDKVGYAYSWIIDKMNENISNQHNTKYPLWCWVKCYNGICPPKIKGKKVDGFDVKITFNKNEKDVFITDFRRYSFLLNNMYIPKDMNDKKNFDNLLNKYSITPIDLLSYVRKDKYKKSRNDIGFIEICDKIRDSFDRCITKDSNILQGCVWRINKEDIEKIEILKDDGYIYGSLNYIRKSGKRFDWIKDYYEIIEEHYGSNKKTK